MDKFKECKEINDFDQVFSFEDFKAEHADLESIKEWLEKLAKWDGQIAKHIKAMETKGLIWVRG